MNQTVKTVLIVVALGVAGTAAYMYWKRKQAGTVTATTVAPPVPATNPQSNTGLAGQVGSAIQSGQDLANSLDSVGDALGLT